MIELMIEQVECADVLVLNKCDAISSEVQAELEAILQGLNRRAEIVATERGRFQPSTCWIASVSIRLPPWALPIGSTR